MVLTELRLQAHTCCRMATPPCCSIPEGKEGLKWRSVVKEKAPREVIDLGKMLYKKPEATTVRGTCVRCNRNPQKSKGNGKFKAICSPCDKTLHHDRKHAINKQDTCEKCGFTSEYPIQFDVDHIDGNHKNNSPENLQTLCSNCHRLKTYLNRDWEKKSPSL